MYKVSVLPQRSRFFIIRFIFALSMVSMAVPLLKAQGILQLDKLPSRVKAEVIGIQDGDTIELKILYTGKNAGYRKGKLLRIRFLHINAPERGKPFYKVAKQYATDKCYRKMVTIEHAGKFDRYGRLLGVVVLPNGQHLNKMLVANGLAIHFKKYSSDQEYAKLEKRAQNKKLGIWSISSVGKD